MPRQLATLIFVLLIVYLFWTDLKKSTDNTSKATWIPLLWMLIAGSRFVSHWIHLGASMQSPDVYTEGTPLDRIVFLFLIILGVFILYQRHLKWSILLRKNIWILLYFFYGVVSIIWSDYPFVSIKRLFKALGNIVMALVILTDQNPDEAFGVVIRRIALLLLPLSVLFIKYYPDIGREYFMGIPMFTGVSKQKNGLGQLCLISGIYFGWHLLFQNRKGVEPKRRLHFSIYLIVIPMIIWLFYMADSATSLTCMIIAICILLIGRLPAMIQKPSRIYIFGIAFVSVIGILEGFFSVSELIIVNILGRDISLTTRVPMWYGLIEMAGNPVIGVGYESFWLGYRLEVLMDMYGDHIRQAHNGYLETYLNLGLIGLFLILAGMINGLIKVRQQLNVEYPFAILRLILIVVVAFYNWTEATFYGVSNIWLLLFIGILDTSGQQEAVAITEIGSTHETPVKSAGSETLRI